MWHTVTVASWEPLPPLDRKHFINSGGVGEVFKDVQHPSRCIKKFFKPVTGDEARQLAFLIEAGAWARPSEKHILESRFSWPLVGHGSADRIEGFSMTYAPDDAQFVLQIGGKPRKVLLQSKYLLSESFWTNNKALTSARPNVDEQDRISIAAEFLDAMEVLHRHDLVYGDVSGNNVCVRLGDFPSVFLLDADSVMSPDLRRRNLVRTPDWEISDALDPISADRSLTALFIWRLLTATPRARPSVKDARNLPGVVGTTCGLLLVELYETGSATAAQELQVAIRASRTAARVEKSYTRALKTGFARLVINESSKLLTKDQLDMFAKAERFVQLEEDVEQASGPRQRRLLNRIGTLDFPFVFDLSSVALVGSPPAGVEDLKRMLQDAEFSEVAQHLAVSGLGKLENHWMVERALKHAYVQMGESAFAARAKAEHGVISWRWPSVRYINTVRLEFSKEGKSILVDEIQRDFVQTSTERSLSVPGGGNITTVLRFGTRSPSGRTFWVDSATRLKFAVPAPPVVRTSTKLQSQATLVDSQSLALQLHHQQELDRLAALNEVRRRRRRMVAAVGGTATSAAAAVAVLLLWPASEAIDLCRIPSIQSLGACGQNQVGSIDVADRFGLP
jgi:hypothetical protein